MTDRDIQEYTALRATIRERGTARVFLFVIGVSIWAALAVATAALGPTPVATLLPLIVLVATFEAVFALHIGVERIGRYLQVFHQDRWEAAAMSFGAGAPGTATDALFTAIFAIATLLNFVPVMLAEPTTAEVWAFGIAHVAFLARLALARRAAQGQRPIESARMEEIKSQRS
jgi:hypothetical protein